VNNPNYVTDVKQRDIVKKPLYPETMPSVKFDSMTIYRLGSNIGGDFVVYLKDIRWSTTWRSSILKGT